MAIHDSSQVNQSQAGAAEQEQPQETSNSIEDFSSKLDSFNLKPAFTAVEQLSTGITMINDDQLPITGTLHSLPAASPRSQGLRGPVSLGDVLASYQREDVTFDEIKRPNDLLAAPGRMYTAARMSVGHAYRQLVG